jgi:hypothetical protein
VTDRRALAHDLRAVVEGEVRFDTAARALYATDASNFRSRRSSSKRVRSTKATGGLEADLALPRAMGIEAREVKPGAAASPAHGASRAHGSRGFRRDFATLARCRAP